MALDKDRLGTAIHNAIQAQGIAAGTAITSGQLETMWQAIAQEIIDEFKNNATVPVPFVSGVTPGGGQSGPGTGTIV